MHVNRQVPVMLCVAMLTASACSGEPKSAAQRVVQNAPDSTINGGAPADAAVQDTGGMSDMPAMDHAAMKQTAGRAGGAAMAPGMDHNRMQGSAKPADHTGMAMAPSRERANMGMDHNRMTQKQAPPANAPAAHDPSAAIERSVDADATTKLKQLMSALLGDSVARERMAGDTALLRRWSHDAQPRQH